MYSASPTNDIQPFYFGADHRNLFGCYHIPTREQGAPVVLCSSIGDEYIRAHRALRQLAMRLSKAGHPVLRFDYSGCGDSAGEDVDATIAGWLADVSQAIEEVKARARVNRVLLVGLRLGAALAALAAEGRNDIAGMVLWEPVVSGVDYLDTLTQAHQERMWYFLSTPAQSKRVSESGMELLGFTISDRLRAELEQVNLLNLKVQPGRPVFIIEKDEQPLVSQLKQYCEHRGVNLSYQQMDSPVIWKEDPDKALVPHLVLQAIVQWIDGEKL